MKKFTVIIPVYNAANYLKDCLDSVVGQNYEHWQAICVNDGSTDRSLDILEEYAIHDARIRVFSQDNKGVSAARNYALNNVDCNHDNWITFLDADDFIAPDMFSSLNAILNKVGTDNIEYLRMKCIQLSNRKIPMMGGILTYRLLTKEEYFREGKVGGYIASIIIRSDFLKKCEILLPENMRVLEDQVFSIRLALRADNILVIDRPFYYYCQDSNSQGNLNFNVDDIIRCVNILWKDFKHCGNKYIQSYFHKRFMPIKAAMIHKFGDMKYQHETLSDDLCLNRYIWRYYLQTAIAMPRRVLLKILSVLR